MRSWTFNVKFIYISMYDIKQPMSIFCMWWYKKNLSFQNTNTKCKHLWPNQNEISKVKSNIHQHEIICKILGPAFPFLFTFFVLFIFFILTIWLRIFHSEYLCYFIYHVWKSNCFRCAKHTNLYANEFLCAYHKLKFIISHYLLFIHHSYNNFPENSQCVCVCVCPF